MPDERYVIDVLVYSPSMVSSYLMEISLTSNTEPIGSFFIASVCVRNCVCGLVRTYIRGQFCVFNHLTGDVRQVGTSPDVFTSPINFLSHIEHV